MKTTALLLVFLAARALAQVSPHGELAIPCEACHSADSWKLRSDAMFNHDSTGFSLEGRHRVITCASCHEGLVFTKRRPVCTSCHADVHQSEVGSDCLRCHTMESWIISDMKQKHQQTRFPLVGNHALADCEACHARISSHRYAGTPLACIGCHLREFEATTSPNHTGQGFPIDCSRCHAVVASAWPAKVDHDLTSFPLTGAHRAVPCTQCHVNNQFKKIASDCYSCHAQNFTQAQSPGHAAGGFSHACLSCHTTTAWSPASFDHGTTRFPLTGTHVTTQCVACHANGNYQLTFVECFQCHQTDFQRPTNPDHVAPGLSHDCTPCHTTTAWIPSTFKHDGLYFRIYSGAHQGRWSLCTDCHQNKSNFAEFTCTTCHGKSTTDSHHSGISGYTYSSSACYSCHPNGGGG